MTPRLPDAEGRGRAQRGVSLIEALVALAVMAFGMLGIVGIQSSLRFNADVSKQRAEAVRVAQESLERWRSFSTMPITAGKVGWADIADLVEPVTGYATNASYSRAVTVVDNPGQNFKTVTVDVSWSDRSGNPMTVSLKSVIHRSPAALAGSLAISGEGTVTHQLHGRSRFIPPQAVDLGDGTSSLSPPGAGSVSWRFSNVSGLIVSRCIGASCVAVNARLVAGHIRFATGSSAPTAVDAESPSGPVVPITVSVAQTHPATVPAPECFTEPVPAAPATAVAMRYLCAVGVAPPDLTWSGRVELAGLPWAASVGSSGAGDYRVCRYTQMGTNAAVGTDLDPGPAVRLLRNADHPRVYALADVSYLSHNFLVIRAGDGTSAFACPPDDPATPFVNGNTFQHQPAT